MAGSPGKPQHPASACNLKSNESNFHRGIAEEIVWLEHARVEVSADKAVDQNTQVSWAAFNSHQQYYAYPPPAAISALLPLFHDQAKSVAMIRHAMTVIQLSLSVLNHV